MKEEQVIRLRSHRSVMLRNVQQLELFPRPVPENWQLLSTEAFKLDEENYRAIRRCYDAVYKSFLPGPGVTPFSTQVAQLLREHGIDIGARQVVQLVNRARELGIDDFPDVKRRRSIQPTSPEAQNLQTPGPPIRMSPDEHNAFARIYRAMLKDGFPKKEKGKGFYFEASTRMKKDGFDLSPENLRNYASYRRRLGDANFPRLRGSHDLERMHVTAIDRIQALGVMATGLMHEILQPLQVILGEAALQQKDVQNDRVEAKKVGERMERIIDQVKKMSSVVQHVRTIARAGEPRLGPVELGAAIDNALSLFLSQLSGKGIHVDRDGIPSNLSHIHADAVAVERIFINLLTNARDAIEEKARHEGTIRISAHEGAEFVVCEVIDDGTGIAEENRSRIFDPYYTTKEVGKGTGMGLTEVMNLMVQFGGRITVDSIPGQSTTFKMEFPKHAEAE